ncbi:hypothetical protein ACTJK6_14495 [Ralstonia sp. 22086]|uniref:hypothetical protein n=1 Tax=Ralstonia sp. 22086 TaxID=3453870 RepID=UPI003F880004
MLQSLASALLFALLSVLAAGLVCARAMPLNAPMAIRRKNAKRGRARENSGMSEQKFETNVSEGNGGHAILVEPPECRMTSERRKRLTHLQ